MKRMTLHVDIYPLTHVRTLMAGGCHARCQLSSRFKNKHSHTLMDLGVWSLARGHNDTEEPGFESPGFQLVDDI